ncbi:MAG: polysulfide reductase NrfD [Dehalococcoidia bacterium]|nr:polysulfide reductase NrfD [Dehalococcoidia bacterium]
MELTYTPVEGKSRRYYTALAVLAAIALAGLISFAISYLRGHQMFGSSNVIPWGLPIVIAIYLIGLSAGSLILSSLTYVFGQESYKPIARMAVFLAIVLIFGAMIAIAVDLGRPEKAWRLFMFFYLNNMTSMFALNGILYGGYFVISLVYLGAILANKLKWVKRIGILAVCWAVLVHMGTGAIFGFIATREIFYSPMKPLEFLVAAMVSGLALLIIAVYFTMKLTRRSVSHEIIFNLRKLLTMLIILLLVLVVVDKLTHAYSPNRDATMFLLTGRYSPFFWAGQVGLGYVIPLIILLNPKTNKTIKWIMIAAASVVIGIFFERLALVIPGLAYPLHYYPGHVEGVWGQVGTFPIMATEVVLSVGMFAFLGALYFLGLRFMDLLPPPEPEPVPEPAAESAPEPATEEAAPAEE